MIAALYVETNGVYYGLPDVDPWDEARDARLYDGPWPVVAHPPCKVWSQMGHCRPEIIRGDDGGCFEHAVWAVRCFGGVLEHPARTHAFRSHGIPAPTGRGCWTQTLDGEWVGHVDQAAYGHPCNKPTWLYYVGDTPPLLLDMSEPRRVRTVAQDGGGGRDQRSRTPPAFRDVLLDLARSAVRVPAGEQAQGEKP